MPAPAQTYVYRYTNCFEAHLTITPRLWDGRKPLKCGRIQTSYVVNWSCCHERANTNISSSHAIRFAEHRVRSAVPFDSRADCGR